ncbi:hypothetical protein ABMA32_06980 [Mesorhizobium sp. VNQ89]|uniref:hypothetical protein n=1 Tax=Mesorhizobium quangtriensis TaxID=3157709 RepID=UPI0032B8657F
MKALVGAVIAVALASGGIGSVAAQQRYDRKLEEAVIGIVASKMGDIRGGFALDTKPVMIVVHGDVVRSTTELTATHRPAPVDGLARAVEQKAVELPPSESPAR